MKDIKGGKLTNKLHDILSLTLVTMWCVLSFIMLYLVKLEYITEELSIIIVAIGLLVVMGNDLFLGLYFKEYPSAYGNIKKDEYPKSYIFRTIFDFLFILALCWFLVLKILNN